MSGVLSKAWHIVCGWCGYEETIVADCRKGEAISHASDPGWRVTTERGWLCPDCADKWSKGQRP